MRVLSRRRRRPFPRDVLEIWVLSRRRRRPSSCAVLELCVEKLVLDLLRGRGKSIDGDLNIDDEGFE
jgi:hypothetical protein